MEDDHRIDPRDEAALASWAERLCTTPGELRRAIDEVGPEVDRVKRYLFVALAARKSPRD